MTYRECGLWFLENCAWRSGQCHCQQRTESRTGVGFLPCWAPGPGDITPRLCRKECLDGFSLVWLRSFLRKHFVTCTILANFNVVLCYANLLIVLVKISERKCSFRRTIFILLGYTTSCLPIGLSSGREEIDWVKALILWDLMRHQDSYK